jgi:ribose transport system permease protein
VAVVAIVVLAIIGLTLWHTRLGRNFIACGTNPTAAHILGLHVRRYEIAAYTLAGVLYAGAGLLLAGTVVQPDTTLGLPYQLTAIVAVVLGGALFGGGPASVTSTAAGALFLGLLDEYLAVRNIAAGLRVLTQGVVLLVAVAVVTTTTSRRGALGVPDFLGKVRRKGSSTEMATQQESSSVSTRGGVIE